MTSSFIDALKQDLDAKGLMMIKKPDPKDKSCVGPGSTHNACSCFLERVAKLEKAAETVNEWFEEALSYNIPIRTSELKKIHNVLVEALSQQVAGK